MRHVPGLLLCIFLFAAKASFAKSNDELSIRTVLENQSQAWNRGDITGYMKGYWHHDSLMFIGKSGITYGWQNTLDNYRKGYPDATAMGKLTFTILSVKKLSDQYQQVVGKWALQRTKGNLDGHFTLLFQKIKGEWFIVSDHSS